MSIQVGSVSVEINPDGSNFNKKLKAILDKATSKIDIEVDTQAAQSKIDAAFKDIVINLKVDADISGAKATLESLHNFQISVDAEFDRVQVKKALVLATKGMNVGADLNLGGAGGSKGGIKLPKIGRALFGPIGKVLDTVLQSSINAFIQFFAAKKIKLKTEIDTKGAVKESLRVNALLNDVSDKAVRARINELNKTVPIIAKVEVDDVEAKGQLKLFDKWGNDLLGNTIHARVVAELINAEVQIRRFWQRWNDKALSVGVDAQTFDATAHLDLWRARQSRKEINIDVDINNDVLGTAFAAGAGLVIGALAVAKGFDAMAESTQVAASGLHVLSNIAQGFSEVAKGLAKAVSSVVSNLVASASAAVGAAVATAAEAVGSAGLTLILALLAAVLILVAGAFIGGAVAAALFAIAALITAGIVAIVTIGIVALAGAIAILPGVIFGVVGALGVLVVAFMPVIKALTAWNALTKARGKDATKSAKADIAAGRAIRNAGEAVVKSEAAVGKARKDAVKDLERLKKAVLDAAAAQRSANNTALEAAAEAAGASPELLDRLRLENKVAESIDGVAAANRNKAIADKELADAQKKGIDGSDGVVAALESQRLAQRSLTEARQDAAIKAEINSAQEDEFRDSMKQLSDAGKKFVESIIAMMDVLKPLSKALQEAMLPGFTTFIQTITTLLKPGGVLYNGLILVAGAIGDVAKLFAAMFADESVKKDLATLLTVSAAAIRSFGPDFISLFKDILSVMADAGEALQPVFNAVGDGFKAAGPALKAFFAALSDKKAITALVTGMGAFFTILNGIWPILGPFVAKLIEFGGPWLEKLAGKDGRGPLMLLFESLLAVILDLARGGMLDGLIVLISTLAGIFADMVASGTIREISEAFGAVMIALGNALKDIDLPTLIDSLLTITLTFIAMLPSIIEFIGLIIDIIALISPVFIPMMDSLIIGLKILGAVILFIGFLFYALIVVIATVWRMLVNFYDDLFGHSIVPDMYEGFKHYFGLIKDIITGVKDWIVEKFNAVIEFFKGLPAKISSAASGMWDGLKSGFIAVLNVIIDAWNKLDFAIDITVPDWVPGVGGKGFQVDDIFPDITPLARGGIVTGPTLALMGESGSEAVIPLAQFNSLSRALGSAGSAGALGNEGSSKTFVFNQNGDIHQDVDMSLVLSKMELMGMRM